MLREKPTDRADIYIVHTEMEWQVAKAIGRALDAHGYVIAPTKTLELPGRRVVKTLPADADAVIVIWPIAPTEFGMPTLELEARAAARRGALVQIFAGVARPGEPYPGRAPVDFTVWDRTNTSGEFRALLRRLRPLCGPPRTRPPDVVRATTQTIMFATTMVALGAIFLALGQSIRRHELQASPALAPVSPVEERDTRVALSAAIAKDKRADNATFTVEPDRANIGGLENGYDKDLGVDPADTVLTPPTPPPAPPAPPPRAPQGPEPN